MLAKVVWLDQARDDLIFYRHDHSIGEVAIVTILDGRRDIAALLTDL